VGDGEEDNFINQYISDYWVSAGFRIFKAGE